MALESAMALLAFAIACFGLGYTLGKDLNTKQK